MSNGYIDEKSSQRQRVCYKCQSFVTHDKVDDNHLACPLCRNQIETRPTDRVSPISYQAFAKIVAAQVKAREQKVKSLK